MIELMILYVLQNRDFTMYSVHKRIHEIFGAFTTPSFGAVKPALVRLEKSGAITSVKMMSDGGKLSVYYSITKDGIKELRKLLLTPISQNPLQFFSEAGIKLSCMSVLDKDAQSEVYFDLRTTALNHKITAEKTSENEYISLTHYQRTVLDNTICQYKNFVSLLDGLEKAGE